MAVDLLQHFGRHAAIGFGCAVMMVGLLIASKTDVQPWLERARPYIGDRWLTVELQLWKVPATT